MFRLILPLITGGLFITSLPLYTGTLQILIVACFCVFFLLAFFFPVSSFLLVLLVGPVFGNQPAGRFMELYDFLILFWISGAIISPQYRKNFTESNVRISSFKTLLLPGLFVISGLVSILLNWEIYSSDCCQLFPYHLFKAPEYTLLYPFRILIMTILIILSVHTFIVCAEFKKWTRFVKPVNYLEPGKGKSFQALGRILTATFLLSVTFGFLLYNTDIRQIHESFLSYLGIAVNYSLARDFPASISGMIDYSMQGPFMNRTWLGMYLISTLPFILDRIEGKMLPFRWLLMFLLFTGGFFFIFPVIGARGAYLSFLMAFIVYVLLTLSKRRLHSLNKIFPIFSFLALAFVLMIALFPFIALWLDSYDSRQEYFRLALRIFAAAPFFGHGSESYGLLNNLSPYGLLTSPYYTSHNLLLQILTGQGLVGALIFLAIVYSITRRLLGSNRYGFLAGWIALIFYSLFQEWFYLRPLHLLWWLPVIFVLQLIPMHSSSREKTDTISGKQGTDAMFRKIAIVSGSLFFLAGILHIAFAAKFKSRSDLFPLQYNLDIPVTSGMDTGRWTLGSKSRIVIFDPILRTAQENMPSNINDQFQMIDFYPPAIGSKISLQQISCDILQDQQSYFNQSYTYFCVKAHVEATEIAESVANDTPQPQTIRIMQIDDREPYATEPPGDIQSLPGRESIHLLRMHSDFSTNELLNADLRNVLIIEVTCDQEVLVAKPYGDPDMRKRCMYFTTEPDLQYTIR